MLDISKIEAGRFHLSRNEVQLSAFLDEIVAMFRLQATAKGIEFRHVRTGRLPVVIQTDENRLRQILINLLSNAIKFTDAGHVTFRVRYHHQVAEFTVEDTGVGIHSSDLERIFQPFERARTVGALATIGTGLGLTITSLLTKIMGGDISVESEVGKGSTFRVKLLLSEVTRPRIASTMEYRVRGYGGPRQTVLVVDDNEVQRELIRDLLEPLGFVVVSAGKRPRMPADCRADEPESHLCSTLRCREWTAGKWRSNCAAIKGNVRQYLFFRRARSIPTTCSKPSGSTTIR